MVFYSLQIYLVFLHLQMSVLWRFLPSPSRTTLYSIQHLNHFKQSPPYCYYYSTLQMPSWRPFHYLAKYMFSGSYKGCLVDWQPSPFAATSCPVSWLTVAVSYWLQTVDFFAWSGAGSLCTLRSWIFCASLSFEILLSTRDTHRPDGAVWWVVVCTSLCHWSDEWCERTCPGSRFLVWPCLKGNGAFHNSSECERRVGFH